MSVMIEIYYRKPGDSRRETAISDCLGIHQGKVTYREDGRGETICLTAEFQTREDAQAATAALQEIGEHVEGPSDYGDN
jgi:hypothetical protein